MSIFTKVAQTLVKMSLRAKIITASVTSVALVGVGVGVGVAVANGAKDKANPNIGMEQSADSSLESIYSASSEESSSSDNSVTEVCEHTYLWEVVSISTCSKEGEGKYTCTLCGDSYTVAIDKPPHDYIVSQLFVPTCESLGMDKYVCEHCGDTQYAETPAYEHVFHAYSADGNAACGVDGTKTAYCERENCDAVDTLPDEGSALEHSFTNYISDGNATCLVDGTKTASCIHGCGETHTMWDGGSKLRHAYGEYISDDNATCCADGTKTAVCIHGCDGTHTITDEGTKKAHSFSDYVSDGNATCEGNGTERALCDYGCGETDVRIDADSALGHSFTNYIPNADAACERDGTETAFCDRDCGETDTKLREESALGHSFTNYTSDYNATCIADGTETALCDHGCKKTDTRTAVGSALGHSFTNYTSDYNATCEEDGTKTATCDHCEKTSTITEVNSALGHSYTHYVYNQDATYDSDGTKTATCDNGCGSQHTLPAEGTKLSSSILFKTLEKVGLELYGQVSNRVENFSFEGEVQVVGSIDYRLAKDANGAELLSEKTIALDVGDNTVYLLVSGEETAVYMVTIRRLPMYTVTFDTDGGTEIASQMVEEGSFVEMPTQPTKQGYIFNGWEYNFAVKVMGDVTIKAKWAVNDATLYKVEHHLQNVEGDGYTLDKTVNCFGETGAQVTATPETYAHFTFESSEGGEILADGSLVLVVYYTRNVYTVAVQNDEMAGSVTGGGNYRYQANVTLVATANDGYTFIGWYQGEKLANEGTRYAFTAEKDVTYTARWKINENTDLDIPGTSGLQFELFGEGYAVTGYTGDDSEVVIPAEYKGKAVVAIADRAFEECTQITSLTMPDTVLSIGTSAFSYCSNLTAVRLSSNLEMIGRFAFNHCEALIKIVIPNAVTQVGSYAFSDCSTLTIYCVAATEPEEWQEYNWNPHERPVEWGYREEN